MRRCKTQANVMIEKDLREQYNPEGSQLRKAQLRMLEMLKFIDKVCLENGITYWLDYGTLLGAVRHGGFIPWDDDADICMPIDDLKRFRDLMLNTNMSNEFVIQCHESDHAYLRSQWIVLRDLKSEYIQDSDFHRALKYRGLQVDIFPVEKGVYIPLKKIVDKLQTWFISGPTYSDKWYYKLFRPFRQLTWNMLNLIVIPLCRCVKSQNSSWALSYGVPIDEKRYSHDIFPLKRIQFEDGIFNAPCNEDAFLTNLYGDWRIIPPPQARETHDVDIVFYTDLP